MMTRSEVIQLFADVTIENCEFSINNFKILETKLQKFLDTETYDTDLFVTLLMAMQSSRQASKDGQKMLDEFMVKHNLEMKGTDLCS